MNSFTKTKVDLSSITGKYPLLGLFLLVTEGLLGLWIFKAANTNERIIAGILMTLILGGFFFVVLQVSKETRVESKKIAPEGLGEVTPASKGASKLEIESPQIQQVASPDGAYIIDRPPDDWIIQQTTLIDFIAGNWGIADPSFKEGVKEKLKRSKNPDQLILAFQAKQSTYIIPIPGQTLIEGRKVPTALEAITPTRLTIMPIDKAQSPLFVERPLIHNFIAFVGDILDLGVLPLRDLSRVTSPNNGRTYLMAEFRQDMENAIVNDKEGQNIKNHNTIIGIEGDIQDYLLIMNYPSQDKNDDPKLRQDLDTLKSLINSFRPLKVLNRDQQLSENKAQNEQMFEELMKNAGRGIFDAEFSILLLRLAGLDLNDPEHRLRIMRLLKPFEIHAKKLGLKDPELDKLWSALHKSEKGNSVELIKTITGLLETTQEPQKPELLAQTEKNEKKRTKKNNK